MPTRVASDAPALVASMIGRKMARVLVFRFVAAVSKTLSEVRRMMSIERVVRVTSVWKIRSVMRAMRVQKVRRAMRVMMVMSMMEDRIVQGGRFVSWRHRVGASVRVCRRRSWQRHDQLCSCV